MSQFFPSGGQSIRPLKAKVKSLSRIQLFVTPWTIAHQAPPSMGFSRQEYWSELPVPSPGDLSDPGIEPRSLALRAEVLTSEPPGIRPLVNPEREGDVAERKRCKTSTAQVLSAQSPGFRPVLIFIGPPLPLFPALH